MLIATCFTTSSFVPQVIATYKSKDVSGISLPTYLIITVGLALWLIYGLLKGDLPLIVANSAMVVLTSAIAVMKIIYTKNKMQLFVLGSFVQACCWTVDRLPKAGETFIANSVTVEASGKGLNVAICTQRLGASVEVALGLGNDNVAHDLVKLLKEEGVSTACTYHLAAQSGYVRGLSAQMGKMQLPCILSPIYC